MQFADNSFYLSKINNTTKNSVLIIFHIMAQIIQYLNIYIIRSWESHKSLAFVWPKRRNNANYSDKTIVMIEIFFNRLVSDLFWKQHHIIYIMRSWESHKSLDFVWPKRRNNANYWLLNIYINQYNIAIQHLYNIVLSGETL